MPTTSTARLATIRSRGGGDDFLNGSSGHDVLRGDAGRDTLFGGADRDVLTGGSEADIFLYTSATDSAGLYYDTITDFQQGAAGFSLFLPKWPGDKIDLHEIDAETDRSGNNAFTFIGQDEFGTTSSGQLRFYHEDGNTFVQMNTDLDVAAEMTIRLTGIVNLTASDFIL